MSNTARNRLNTAISQKEIAALYIDLQTKFMDGSQTTRQAFENCRTLSGYTTQLGIKNYWVANTEQYTTPLTGGSFTPDKIDENFHIVAPHMNDLIIPKNSFSLFWRNPEAEKALGKLPDTLIVAGVHAESCVELSINGAFNAAAKIQKPLHIIIAEDCTNLGATPPETLIRNIREKVAEIYNVNITNDGPYTLDHIRMADITPNIRAA